MALKQDVKKAMRACTKSFGRAVSTNDLYFCVGERMYGSRGPIVDNTAHAEVSRQAFRAARMLERKYGGRTGEDPVARRARRKRDARGRR